MSYLTRKIHIPEYNWTVDVFDPSLGELDTLERAYKSGDVVKVAEAWKPLISDWDFTTRDGNKLLITVETLTSSVPAIILRGMIRSLQEIILKKDDDPKNVSGS